MPRPPVRSLQVADAIEAKIRAGEYSETGWLPSERDLAEELKAGRSTVRRALELLAERGVIRTRHGSSPKIITKDDWRPPLSSTQQGDPVRGVRIVLPPYDKGPLTSAAVEKTTTDAELSEHLRVPEGTTVYAHRRIHGTADNQPHQLICTWIPPETASEFASLKEINTDPQDLYTFFEKKGHELLFKESFHARHPNPQEAEALQIDVNEPVLEAWRHCLNQRDQILEVTWRLIVTTRYTVVYRAYV